MMRHPPLSTCLRFTICDRLGRQVAAKERSRSNRKYEGWQEASFEKVIYIEPAPSTATLDLRTAGHTGCTEHHWMPS